MDSYTLLSREDLERLLVDARYARRQCAMDDSARAADAIERVLVILQDHLNDVPRDDDELLAEMAADLEELERLTDTSPTVNSPQWHANVRPIAGPVVVDVRSDRVRTEVGTASCDPISLIWRAEAGFYLVMAGALVIGGMMIALGIVGLAL